MNVHDNIFLTSSSLELMKVSVQDLKVGMYVSELDRPWMETNFLFQGFELVNQEDIKAVQAQCEFVYVDSIKTKSTVTKTVARDTPYTKGWLEDKKPPAKRSSFEAEFENSEHVYQQASTVVKSFMQEVALGKSINVEIAKKVVAECVNSVLNAPDALMWLTQLKKQDEYTSQHSMNVCILAITLGRQINLSEKELNEVGLCGMMHDMGKMRVPLEVLNKPSRLTPEELKQMNSHTTLGWKLLLSSSGMYSGAIDVAYSHHERLDGKGYPRGLSEEQIIPYAKIVAIVDMYDAITSDRVYQKGRTHLEAISIMTQEGGTHLDLNLTVKFIESLGIYPPASLVEMSNGEVAVVVEVHQKQKIKPKVIFLLDENKQPQKERLVDLALVNVDDFGVPYRIKKIVLADEYNIDLNKYYHNGLLKKTLFTEDNMFSGG